MVAGGDAGGGKDSLGFLLLFPLGRGGGYTHILREVEGLYIVLEIPSIPLRPQYTAPRSLILSHFHWIVTKHTHTQSITTLYSLSLSLFRPRILFLFVLSRSLPRLSTCYSSDILSCFFPPLLIIYTRARSCLSFSYSATFKYRIFHNN